MGELGMSSGYMRVLSGPTEAGTNPTYGAFSAAKGVAYFTNENQQQGIVIAFKLDSDGKLNKLNSQKVEGTHPCFLSTTQLWDRGVVKDAVLCANYVSGDLTVFKTDEDGS